MAGTSVWRTVFYIVMVSKILGINVDYQIMLSNSSAPHVSMKHSIRIVVGKTSYPSAIGDEYHKNPLGCSGLSA